MLGFDPAAFDQTGRIRRATDERRTPGPDPPHGPSRCVIEHEDAHRHGDLGPRYLPQHGGQAPGDRRLKLAIGAPSSPMLSNIHLKSFDDIVFREARERQIVYTRYADDITFSGQRIGMLKDMIGVVTKANKASSIEDKTREDNLRDNERTPYGNGRHTDQRRSD